MTVDAVVGATLAADELTVDAVVGVTLAADEMTVDAVVGATLAADELAADEMTADAVVGATLAADELTAGAVVGATLAADEITVDASAISSSTVKSAQSSVSPIISVTALETNSLEELQVKCLTELEVLSDQLAEYIVLVRKLICEIESSRDKSIERKNLGYFLKITGKHSSQTSQRIQHQVSLSNGGGVKEVMQLQAYSSFCGLCAMNNAVTFK